jgi:hypothetical protein
LLPFTVVIIAAVVDIAAAAAAALSSVVVVFSADIIIDVSLLHRNTLSMHTCDFRIPFAMVIVCQVTPGYSPYISSLLSLY